MQLKDIREAYSLANLLYDVEPDNFEDLALNAWERIGQKHTRLYRYIADTDEEGKIELPCNVDRLESVHLPFPDAQFTSNKTDFYDPESLIIERFVDRNKHFEDPDYTNGKLVKYSEEGNTLRFAHPYKNIMVVYRGVIADEDSGLPMVTDKEIQAIAAYVAYASLFREGIRKKDSNLLTIAQAIQKDWLRLCNNARTPEYLNQNDMDKILDAKTSWNRKQYGKSFKPCN